MVYVKLIQRRIEATLSSSDFLLDELGRLQKHFLYFGFNQQNVMTKNRSTTTDPIDTRPTLCRKLRLLLVQATASLLLLKNELLYVNFDLADMKLVLFVGGSSPNLANPSFQIASAWPECIEFLLHLLLDILWI